MHDVGINIKLTENSSGVASSMAQNFRNISSIAEEMKEALNMEDVMPQYKKFADMVDQLYTMRRANQEREAAEDRRAGRAGPVTRGIQTAGESLKRAGGVTGRLGAGDVLGAGADVAGTLQGVLQKAGPAGAILGLVAGTFFVVDALTKQYEKHLPVVMELTTQMDRLKESSKDTSVQFLRTMDEIATSSAKFGRTLEEGTAVYKELLRAGSRYDTQAQAEQVMGYSRYGLDLAFLARFQGLGARFGFGNVIGPSVGAAQQTGVGPARYQEFLSGTLSIFEEGLSRGIVKGFEEINQTQVWLSQLGELFKGQTGLQMYKKMEAAVIGATGLASESDAIMFRAAKRVADREAEKKGLGAASYIEVMKTMERGLTPQIFGEVREIVQKMSVNRADQVEMMRQLFGVNYTTAEQLLGLEGKAAVTKVAEMPGIYDTPEMRLMKAQNEIMEDLRKVGHSLIEAKMFAIEGANTVVGGLAGLLGADVKAKEAKRDYEKWEKTGGKATMEEAVEELGKVRGGAARWYEATGYPVTKMQEVIKTSIKKGGQYKEAALVTADLLELISQTAPEQFGAMGGLRRLLETGKGYKAEGEWWADFTWRDMIVVLRELTAMIAKIDTSLLEDKKIDIFTLEGAH